MRATKAPVRRALWQSGFVVARPGRFGRPCSGSVHYMRYRLRMRGKSWSRGTTADRSTEDDRLQASLSVRNVRAPA